MSTREPDDRAAADAAWLANGRSEQIEKPLYRMPVGFGPAPGPRNVPLGKGDFVPQSETTWFSVTALTDGDLLARMLPPGVELRGEPELTVKIFTVRHCYWLAGLTYNVLIIGMPVTSTRGDAPVEGNYYPAEWHSRPDNVITAREEIGWPALWAEISEPVPRGPDAYSAHGSWTGFRFFEMELHDLGDSEAQEPRADGRLTDRDVQLTYKYIPTGYREGADVSQFIVNDLTTYWKGAASVKGVDTSQWRYARTNRIRHGAGSFRFLPARWEDMPTQYHVVNAFAELPLLEFRDAKLVCTDPANDGREQP